MPIRYYIDLDCPPRRELGPEDLLALNIRWERAENVRAQFTEKYQTTDETKMRFRETVRGPDGEPEKMERTVAELRHECRALFDLAKHCKACPAALTSEPYSCLQNIAFPISAVAEQWLLDRLAPSGSRSLELFIDAISRHDYGKIATLGNWRRAGLFESSEPMKADRDGLLVTTDQILNELFFVGDIQPPHALGILIHLQAMKASDGRAGDELLQLIESVDNAGSAEDAPSIDIALAAEEADDDSTRDLKQFLIALFRAFSLQTPLGIRY